MSRKENTLFSSPSSSAISLIRAPTWFNDEIFALLLNVT